MNKIEFARACQPYNKQYKALFGEIPSPTDFACTREEFLAALIQSVEDGTRIQSILPLAAVPDRNQYNY